MKTGRRKRERERKRERKEERKREREYLTLDFRNDRDRDLNILAVVHNSDSMRGWVSEKNILKLQI